MKLLRTLTVALALAFACTLSHAGIIFETGPGTTLAPLSPNNGYGHFLDVDNDTTIEQFGFQIAGTGTFKLRITTGDHGTVLHESIVTFDSETVDWVYSNPFSLVLQAETTYFIGILADASSTWQLWYYQTNGGHTENGITSSNDLDFYLGYDTPVYQNVTAGANMVFRLMDEPINGEVPEPATCFAVGMGLLALTLARRKRSLQ